MNRGFGRDQVCIFIALNFVFFGFDQQQKEELDISINRIEKFYFGEDRDVEAEDLKSLASTWVSKAK